MVTKSYTGEGGGRGHGFARISVALVVVGAFLLSAGIYAAWRVYRLQQRGDDMLSENVASVRAAEELETVVREFQYRLKRSLATTEIRHIEQITGRLGEGERWLHEAEMLAKTTREQQLVARMRRGYERLEDDLGDLEGREFSGATVQSTLNTLADEVIPNKILVFLDKYIQHNEEELAAASERNQATARRLMYGLLLLGSCGGAAGLLAGYMIARSVSRTIVQLSVPIRDTAGKLNEVVGPVAISARPGFEDLQSVLQTLAEHVSTVVERLQVREREMLRAEQLAAVGQLAAGMAHELRNPLTALKTILQLSKTSADLSERDLQVLNAEVRRLEQSVQQFLDFARPPQPEKRFLNLTELLDQSVDLMARRAQQQGVRLECDAATEPLHVMADATQLRQVVLNLVLNGCDATPRGGVVRIEADGGKSKSLVGKKDLDGKKNSDRCGVTIRVRDSGSGLPAALGERIFEPFISTKETGLGLGLSICRRIVEAHGGQISAADISSGGTVFSVWLPHQEANGDRPSSPANSRRPLGVSYSNT